VLPTSSPVSALFIRVSLARLNARQNLRWVGLDASIAGQSPQSAVKFTRLIDQLLGDAV
jgi:hypothetical protein